MKFLASGIIIIIIISIINDSIATNSDIGEVVEIAMDDFKPEKCRHADYRGFIVEEIDLKNTFIFPNGYEKQIYCSPFNSTLFKSLLGQVTDKAKKLRSNLICGAKLMLHNDGKVFNMNNFEQTLPCFAMMTAPAYFYQAGTKQTQNNTTISD